MEIKKRKTVFDDLNKYDYLSKENDFIEITEWSNGEGWDITLNERTIQLTSGQLDAINYLVNVLTYEKKKD